MACQLLIVIPVHNKEDSLEGVLREWITELDRTAIDFEILLLDDGSADGTPAVIDRLVQGGADGRIRSKRHDHIGHGQACLEGYRQACWNGVPWVFQIDSDGRCDPAYFPALWAARHDHDVVYGRRTGRRDGWSRVPARFLVRGLARIAAGVHCPDANVPYRLMSTARLLPVINTVPPSFRLANIAMAVQIKRLGWREATVPITFRPPARREVSVPFVRAAGQALELFGQILLLPRPVLRGGDRPLK